MDDKFAPFDRIMQEGIYATFEDIEYKRVVTGIKPSEIMRHLDMYWDLGDYWQEWWTESGEEWT